jgi:aminoglycoside phosphotransferase (APT) family kinase protein
MADSMLSPREAMDAALSTSKVSEIVEKTLGIASMGIAVRGCRIKEIHPGRFGALELEYQLDILDSSNQEQSVATVWGTLYENKGRGERHYVKLRRRLNTHKISFSTKSLSGFATYDTEIGLLLRTSVVGDKLPGLTGALDSESIMPILRAHLNHDSTEPARDYELDIDVLRYKNPGNRCTFGYCLRKAANRGDETEDWRFIGKTYRSPDEAKRDFHLMRTLHDNGFGKDATDNVWAPSPVAYLPDHNMVLMETIPGQALSKIQTSPEFADHIGLAGRALAKFHRTSLELPRKHRPEDEIAGLKTYAERAAKVFPDLTAAFDAKLDEIERMSREVTSDRLALVHRDFNFSNLIVENGGIGVIDFDAACNGSAALDVGGFLARLKWAALRRSWPGEKQQANARNFLEAYGAPAMVELADEIRFYYRSFLLRLGYFSVHRPRFHRLHNQLLDEIDAPVL